MSRTSRVAILVCIASSVAHADTAATGKPTCDAVEVVDQLGRPVADALVIRLDGPVAGGGTGYAKTDARGRFCVAAGDRAFDFDVYAPDERGGVCAGRVHIDAKAHPARVTMPLDEPSRATLHGKVVDDHGKPVAGARVELLAEIVAHRCYGGFVSRDPVTTPADGSFSFAVFAGKAEVYVTATGFAPHDAVLETDGFGIVALDQGVRWSGRVFGATGKLLPNAKLETEWGQRPTVELPLVSGAFDVSRLIPGPHDVKLEITDDPVLATRWELRHVTLVNHEHHIEDMRFASGKDVSGVISDAHGCVIAAPAEYNRNGVEDSRVRTTPDAAGHFVFHHLSPGKWVISNCIEFPKIVVDSGARNIVVPAP